MTVACQQQMMEVVRAGSTRGGGINKLARLNVGGHDGIWLTIYLLGSNLFNHFV
jgi:hypothetical protein